MKNKLLMACTYILATQTSIGLSAGLPDIKQSVRFNNIPADLCHYGGANTTFRFVNREPASIEYDTVQIKVTGLMSSDLHASNAGSLAAGIVDFRLNDYWLYASIMGMNQQQFGFDAYAGTHSVQYFVAPFATINPTPDLRWSDMSNDMAVNVPNDIANTYPIRLTCYGYGNNHPSADVVSGSVQSASADYNLKAALVTLVWKDLQ